jgi:hypothetical protein
MKSRGYPLGALFVLVTACAVIVAAVTPMIRFTVRGNQDVGEFFAALGAGAGCGLVLGMVVGLFQYRRGLGLAMGAGAGILIGAAAGVMGLTPAHELTAAAAAMTAGSGLIIAVALVMRRAEE